MTQDELDKLQGWGNLIFSVLDPEIWELMENPPLREGDYDAIITRDGMISIRNQGSKKAPLFRLMPNSNDLKIPIIKAYWESTFFNEFGNISTLPEVHRIYLKLKASVK